MDLNRYASLIASKNEEAFEKVYHSTKNAVYSVIIAVVRNNAAAEDLMQDTYMEMVSSINSFNPKYKLKTWVTIIARNKAIDFYRKNKKKTNLDEAEIDYLNVQENDMFNYESLASDLLNLLSAEERQVVLLHINDSMKFKEIALVMRKSINTVLWIYNKALKKMKLEYRREQ